MHSELKGTKKDCMRNLGRIAKVFQIFWEYFQNEINYKTLFYIWIDYNFRNLGCLGRENFCIAGISQCCPGLKCRQTNPMLPFSRCQPWEDRNRNKGYIMFLDTSVFLKFIELKNNDQFRSIYYLQTIFDIFFKFFSKFIVI